MAKTLSVPVIARNVIKLKYPVERCLLSVAPIADEFVFVVDPTSEDDTVDQMMFYGQMLNEMFDSRVVVVENPWNMENISESGAEFSSQTNRGIVECTGDWVLSLQCDEAIHEKDHDKLKYLLDWADEKDIDSYAMMRLYFYGDMNTIRTDWSVPITRLFRRGTRMSHRDAMDTVGPKAPVQCGIPMYHYSRIGDPEIISRRIRTLDGLFHDEDELLDESELKPYDFVPRNFDCMHKDGVDVGKREVDGDILMKFDGTHPLPFKDYEG